MGAGAAAEEGGDAAGWMSLIGPTSVLSVSPPEEPRVCGASSSQTLSLPVFLEVLRQSDNQAASMLGSPLLQSPS